MIKRILMVAAMFAAAGAGCAQGVGEEGAPGEDGDLGEAASAVVSQSSQMTRVGRQIFFDTNLSSPAGQSCASCHATARMFTDPNTSHPTSQGAVTGDFGFRNAPTVAYSAFSPVLTYTVADGWSGGQFWDGRVNTLADQALQPFLNPIEMNNASAAAVVAKVQASAYAPLFIAAFGAGAFSDVPTAFANIGKCVQKFEQQKLFYPFTSTFDAYLAGKATLTPSQANGLALFSDTTRANCINCHTIAKDSDGDPAALFTDYGYDNLGVPKNPNNPYYSEPTINPLGSAFNDRGLGATIADTNFDGYFKSPTLRNLARTGPYMHNGYFSTLSAVVHFYNTRDVPGAGWPTPEFPATMNTTDLGNIGLSSSEESDLVAFLGTLNDATSTINGSCTTTATYAIANAETPNHEPGTCGPAPEFMQEEATIQCGGKALKYFSYSCTSNPDGTHTWTAYFGCC